MYTHYKYIIEIETKSWRITMRNVLKNRIKEVLDMDSLVENCLER